MLIALVLPTIGAACSRGVLHTGVASSPVAPAIPVPTYPDGTCDPGLEACPGQGAGYCFNLQASPEHCGACGHACALGSPCEAGQCRVIRCTSRMSVASLRVDYGFGQRYQIALGDFDRDGAIDMIAPSRAGGLTQYSTVSVFRGHGDGTFDEGERYSAAVNVPAAQFDFPVVVADLNRDQIPDFVTRVALASDASSAIDEETTIVARLGNGDGTFGAEIGLAAGAAPSSIAIADLDGDGRLDLANVAEEGHRVSVYHGNGDGSFSERQDLAVGGTPWSVTVADWNADGVPDLVAADRYIHLLLGAGHGHFAPVIDCALTLMTSLDAPTMPPVIADFDQDGAVDLVSNNTVLFGMRECNFTGLATYDVSSSAAFPLVAGDFNGDGAADLAFSSWDGIGYLPGDGQGSFRDVVTLGDLDQANAQPNLTAGFAGDVNGDGRLDLMVANHISIRTFLNTCQ